MYRETLLVFGGFNSANGFLPHCNELLFFDAAAGRWASPGAIEAAGEPPANRDKHAAVVDGDRMLVYGGWGPQPAAGSRFAAEHTRMDAVHAEGWFSGSVTLFHPVPPHRVTAALWSL